jgi:hypothetical protein
LIAEAVFRNYHGLVGALPLGTQSCVFGSCRRASESEIANVPDAVGATRKHHGAAGSRSPAEISHEWLDVTQQRRWRGSDLVMGIARHRPLRGVSDWPASLGNRSRTPPSRRCKVEMILVPPAVADPHIEVARQIPAQGSLSKKR